MTEFVYFFPLLFVGRVLESFSVNLSQPSKLFHTPGGMSLLYFSLFFNICMKCGQGWGPVLSFPHWLSPMRISCVVGYLQQLKVSPFRTKIMLFFYLSPVFIPPNPFQTKQDLLFGILVGFFHFSFHNIWYCFWSHFIHCFFWFWLFLFRGWIQ